eukprot:2136902-Pyramimonas_sp.AAC.1
MVCTTLCRIVPPPRRLPLSLPFSPFFRVVPPHCGRSLLVPAADVAVPQVRALMNGVVHKRSFADVHASDLQAAVKEAAHRLQLLPQCMPDLILQASVGEAALQTGPLSPQHRSRQIPPS